MNESNLLELITKLVNKRKEELKSPIHTVYISLYEKAKQTFEDFNNVEFNRILRKLVNEKTINDIWISIHKNNNL